MSVIGGLQLAVLRSASSQALSLEAFVPAAPICHRESFENPILTIQCEGGNSIQTIFAFGTSENLNLLTSKHNADCSPESSGFLHIGKSLKSPISADMT